MLPNVKPSQLYPHAANIAPQSVAAAASASSGWVSVSDIDWLKVALLVGAGAGTFAVKIEQATTVGGAGAKDMATAAQVGITAQGTGQAEADVRVMDYIDVDNGFAFVRVTITCTGGAGTQAAAALFTGPRKYLS